MTTQAGHFFDKETNRIWDMVNHYPEADLYKPIRDDDWTAFMILAHLATTSKGLLNLAKQNYRAVKAGDAPPAPAVDFDLDRFNVEQVALWAGRPLSDVRDSWAETSLRFHQFITTLSDEDLALPARFATGTPMTLGDLLNVVTGHLRMHRLELEKGLQRK